MDSGQARAASLMNAAMRNRFAARIQKYEAKVRQGKVQQRDQHPNPDLVREEKQAASISEKMMMVPEKVVASETRFEKEEELNGKKHQKHHREEDEALEEDTEYYFQHEQALKGFLSDKDVFSNHSNNKKKNHAVEDLPEHHKEIICGMLERSCSLSSSRVKSNNVKGLDVVEMNPKYLPMDMNPNFPPMEINPKFRAMEVDPKFLPMEMNPKFLPMEMNSLDSPPDRVYEEVTPQIDIDALANELRVRIKAADMSLSMQEHAFRCARACLDHLGKLQSKLIAHTLKKVSSCLNHAFMYILSSLGFQRLLW
jgi:hypothetical protein